MNATHYVMVADGRVSGTGWTPDGTFPPGAIGCSEADAEASGPWSAVVDGAVVVGAPPAAPPSTRLPPLDFMARFTSAEQAALASGAQSNPQLLLLLIRLSAAQYIDLADPLTKSGLDALVAAGLLDASRETEILTP